MPHPAPHPVPRWRAAALLCGGACACAALATGLAVTAGRSFAEPATPTTVTSSAAPSPSRSPVTTDPLGYPGTGAHCDESQSAVAFGRTTRALVAICVDPDGSLQYRGVRLRDAASLTMPAGRSSSGAIVATNDGVTYAVTPEVLLVSENDTVLYRDAWVEFREPRFSQDPSSSTKPTGTPTVSTTTVTMSTATTATTGG